MGQPGKISQISVLDAEHRVIASSNEDDVGLTLQELQELRVSGGDQSFWAALLKDHIKTYDYTVPLLTSTWERRYVNVIFVMNDLEYLIKKAKYSNILWIVGFFAGGTLVAIVLVSRFTRPIDQLVAASKAVADGDFEITVPVKNGDEFETLLTGFNEMTLHLREHKALEERYHRSERMAALGELGARLAHEIRNPLHSISLIIDHIRDRFAPEDATNSQKFERYVVNIKTELKRLNKLVSDFLHVSRPSHPEILPIRLMPFLKQIQQFLETETEKRQIACDIQVVPEDLTVLGDENLLKTACLNIALNAIQAMERGGRLQIYAHPHQDLDGAVNACEVVFADTGPGIPEEHRQKIFEPYFTTKKEGTGLGLAIVNRVVADHQGTINIDSQLGKGTTITMILPAENREYGQEEKEE
jgi:signal transduction histidine kinase